MNPIRRSRANVPTVKEDAVDLFEALERLYARKQVLDWLIEALEPLERGVSEALQPPRRKRRGAARKERPRTEPDTTSSKE